MFNLYTEHIGVARGGRKLGARPPKGVKKLHNRFSCAKCKRDEIIRESLTFCFVIVNVNVTKYNAA